jgi:site-specific recombinase XerD
MEGTMPDTTEHNPFMSDDQMTLADVLDQIAGDTTLPQQRRRNLRSAIGAVGKLMDRDLTFLPANPGFYRKMFKGLHPEQCGLSKSRIRNIKSDVLFALKHVGCIEGARTHMAPLSVEWQALWDSAACAGRLRVYVSRLMHYCSARGIQPDQVDDGVADQLRQALIDESFVDDPIRTHKGILRTWNKLADRVPAWPQSTLTIPSDRQDYSIPLDQFPQSFRDEVTALVEQWEAKDILDDTGPIKPLKPRTIKSRLYRLRQAASALVLSGRAIEEVPSITTLVEVEAAKVILRFYLDRAHDKPTSQVHGIAVLLKTLARHWVGVDEEHLGALKDLCAKVDPAIKGLTTKNRDRLRQFDDPKNTCLLLDFPFGQVNRVLNDDRGRRRDAVQVQIALAVALLLMMPVRASNLVGLHLDRHVQRTRSGKKGVVHVVIPGHEVKNEEDLEFELPKEVVQLLDLYLRDYHPRLTDDSSPWLFPGGIEGEHKTVMTLGEQIKAQVFKATGLQVNLHLFRHIAAKLYLDAMPGGYEVVRRLLGHKNSDTTVRFYAGMESKSASRHCPSSYKLEHRAV